MAPLLGGRTSVIAEVLRQAQGRQSVTDEMAEPDRDPSTGGCRQLRPGHHRCWQYWLHGVSRSNQPGRVTRHDQPVAARSPKIALQTCLCWWMENRIKECHLDLFAERTLAATMRANQLRLWFASSACVLLCPLRRIGLAYNPVRPGQLRHHPADAAQDRRAGAHQRAPGQHRHDLSLSL